MASSESAPPAQPFITTLLQALAIVVLSVMAAITYGILLDQVTARACIEYFTIGHPPIFKVPVEDPTLLAIAWGVIATWWMGLGLGMALAIAAQAGSRPKRSAGSLVRPIAKLLMFMAIMAVTFGLLGYFAASQGWVTLAGPLGSRVPKEQHIVFLADLWAHLASYFFGAVGGMFVIVQTWRSRRVV